MPKKHIFVSCGVHTEDERQFGKSIKELIESHEFSSFVAPTIHQPADLNTHVFQQLQLCDGFVAVLQKRGEVSYEKFPVKHRASVWIQQEIGIIFYRSFLIGRPIPTRIYIEEGILREGLTLYSIINPIEFQKKETVLEDLSQWLKGSTFAEQPVIARRKDIFERRTKSYNEYNWLILELIAAHCRNPGDVANYNMVLADFMAIQCERGHSHDEAGVFFENARVPLLTDGLISRATDHDTGATSLRMAPQWWDFVVEELRNRARIS